MSTLTEQSTVTRKQVKTFGPKTITYYGEPATITAEVRFDDECGNGHNSFAITGDIYRAGKPKNDSNFLAGGCLHDEIAKHFPQLAPFIKWHLTSTDGPMHYIANAVYLAGDRDCWGRRKGDVSRTEVGIRFNGVPVTHRVDRKFWNFLRERYEEGSEHTFQIASFAHGPDAGGYKFEDHYSVQGFAEKWHECPFRDRTQADEFIEALNTCVVEFTEVPTAWSEGKERELDAARRAAVWPDATDEDLTAPGLKERLAARADALLADFRRDVESLGFNW